jgi:hypothetical protein
LLRRFRPRYLHHLEQFQRLQVLFRVHGGTNLLHGPSFFISWEWKTLAGW